MKRSFFSMLALSAALVASAINAQPNDPPGPPTTVPVTQLSALQVTALINDPDATFHPLSSLELHTAAMARADAIAPGSAQTTVQRASNAQVSVYASDVTSAVTDTGKAAPPYPGTDDTNQYFDFKQTGDAAQAWALMTASGRPYLSLWNLGQSKTTASASWRTTFTVPGATDQVVYLQFLVPAVKVTGVNEEDGPSLWQSRFRTDVLLNGYPAWNSDVMRYNELNGIVEKARHLSVFGKSLGHVDASNENGDGSSLKTITIYLGRFAPLTKLDVTALYSAESMVKTACKYKDNEWFCSRGTVASTPITSRLMVSPRFVTLPAAY